MDCSQAEAWTAAQVEGIREEAQPVMEAWVDGRLVVALLDSGCTCMLVQQARGQPLGPTLMVRCIHGDGRPYHLRWAKIRVGGDCQFLQIGVVPQLTSPHLWSSDRERLAPVHVSNGGGHGGLGRHRRDQRGADPGPRS